jgi:hypothetical protein
LSILKSFVITYTELKVTHQTSDVSARERAKKKRLAALAGRILGGKVP